MEVKVVNSLAVADCEVLCDRWRRGSDPATKESECRTCNGKYRLHFMPMSFGEIAESRAPGLYLDEMIKCSPFSERPREILYVPCERWFPIDWTRLETEMFCKVEALGDIDDDEKESILRLIEETTLLEVREKMDSGISEKDI